MQLVKTVLLMNYLSVNEKLKSQFGCKVYKLALSAGLTCPNRDGTLDTRGCIFCLDGSGGFCEGPKSNITEQIEAAKARVKNKIKDGKYIAYFQSYTNTYAPPEFLDDIFTQAVEHPDIAVLSVATRPDCLSAPVLSVLKKAAEKKPLWVELGLQTIHNESVNYIRRGYQNEVYQKAVCDLHAIGAEVITHVILFLPNESVDMMKQTVSYAVDCGTDGIKLQLLHVLRGTDLETDYNNGKFTLPTLDEYCRAVCECLKQIPPTVAVHRLTGDGPKRDLVAPLWSADKKRVMNTLNNYIKKEVD